MRQPAVTREHVLARLPADTHPRFATDMVPALWAAGLGYGIDPVGMVAQSGKETGWGNYGGRVPPWFYNTAGIKVRHVREAMALVPTGDGDHPLIHQQFPNWQIGAVAHAQHLRAYTGQTVMGMIVDPRYSLVGPPFVDTWAGLGGRWAPSASYGSEIESIIDRLRS